MSKDRKPFVSREQGGKLRRQGKPEVITGIVKMSVAPIQDVPPLPSIDWESSPEIVTFEVSRQDLTYIEKVMLERCRRDGYVAQVEGKLLFFDMEPDMVAAPITREQILIALSQWPD